MSTSGTGGVGTPRSVELREQQRDRLRLGPLVHAVERLAVAAGEERGDVLVREQHQLLDEHVRVRLALEPRVGDAAVRRSGTTISGVVTSSAPRAKRRARSAVASSPASVELLEHRAAAPRAARAWP